MSEMSQSHLDILHGPLVKNIITFSIPIMLSNVLQTTFHMADRIVVGKFASEQALAAVGSISPISMFFIWGLSGLSIGANVLVSRYIGEGKLDRIQKSVFTTYILGFLCGLFVTCIGVGFSSLFLKWMDIPSDIYQDTLTYLRIFMCIGIPVGIFDFSAAVLRSDGDTKHPTLFLACGGALNVLLNLLFVIVFHMGVVGVGLATVIAESFSVILITHRMMKEKGMIHLEKDFSLFDKQMAIQTLKYGIPSMLQNQLFSISNIIIQTHINSFGSMVVAANTAALSIEEFCYVFADAFPQASIIFTGQFFGARNIRRLKKAFGYNLLFCGVGSFLIGGMAYLFGPFLLSLFTNNPDVIVNGMLRIKNVSIFLFLNGLLDVVVGSIRGMGVSTLPTIVTLLGVCGIRLGYVWFYLPHQKTIEALYRCFPLSWFVTFVVQLFVWYYVFKKRNEESLI